MLKPSNYKHIIWDWNGTLIDDAWLFVDVMNNILQKRNMHTITIEEYRNIFGFPIKNYYEKLGFNTKKESIEMLGLEFIKEYKKRQYEAVLFSMTEMILTQLLNLSIKQYILSACHQKLLDNHLKFYNLEKYFTNIMGVDNYFAKSKINKGIELIKIMQVNPNDILFIGDTKHDFEVAKKIGVDCLLISHGHHSHSQLLKTKTPIIKNLKTILDIFGID